MPNIEHHAGRGRAARWLCTLLVVVTSFAGLSAHVLRGTVSPDLATAFASSPSSGADAVIPVRWGTQDTALGVACFNVANTSAPRADATAWPRVTAVGLELPGTPSGFSLLAPLGEGWELVEQVPVSVPGRGPIVVDVALVLPVNPVGRSTGGTPHALPGLPPGQAAVRGSGTRFCLGGPFTPGAAIETLLNGVVVAFHGVQPHGPSLDLGLWDNPARVVPLFP
jgi:hypothetical protein